MHNNLTTKVCIRGVQTLPPLGFDSMTSKDKTHVLNGLSLEYANHIWPPRSWIQDHHWLLVPIPMDITCKILSCQRHISVWLLVWTYLHNFLSFKISNAIDIIHILFKIHLHKMQYKTSWTCARCNAIHILKFMIKWKFRKQNFKFEWNRM